MSSYKPFTGSYTLDDVEFLLKPIDMVDTSIAIKESLIQSGKKHYSSMLSHESLPSEDYLSLFYQAMQRNQKKVAQDALILAERINANHPEDITLVSLARAGTPVGVVLNHLLKSYYKRNVYHYSVSIIRDVGLDFNALKHILKRHTAESLIFIDGWTGKGVIAKELAESLNRFALTERTTIPTTLYVLSDLSGSATFSASSEDYLIPSCILNATVSGLVSRSVYGAAPLKATDFHGCVFYQQFLNHDLSRYFIDQILSEADIIWQQNNGTKLLSSTEQKTAIQQQIKSKKFLQWITEHYHVSQVNYIKPGIGEATRVLLRREARLLLLKDLTDDATQHLRWLAESRQIPIAVYADLPYLATALIKEIR